MKKPEIKYESWCPDCKSQGTVHCKVCRIETLNVKNLAVLHRPSEFMPKNKYRWVRMERE